MPLVGIERGELVGHRVSIVRDELGCRRSPPRYSVGSALWRTCSPTTVTGEAFDEMIDSEGSVRPSYKAVYATLRSPAPETPGDRRGAGQELHPGRRHLRRRRGGTPVPPRSGAAGHRRARVGDHRGGRGAASQGPRGLPLRRYSDARVISDGVIPSQFVTSSNHFHRAVWGIHPATAFGSMSPGSI